MPAGEKHLRPIIDHLSNGASSRRYPRNHYASLCFRLLKFHPVSWWLTVRCFFLDGQVQAARVLSRINDTLSHASVDGLSSRTSLPGFPFPFRFVLFAVANHGSSQRSSWKLAANSGFSTRVNAMTHKRPTDAFKFPIDKLLRNLRNASRPLIRLRISAYVISESDRRVMNELRTSEQQPS